MAELTAGERKQIYEEEKSRHEIEQARIIRSSFLSKKTVSLAICAVVVLGIVGSVGYHVYQIHGLKQRLEDAIGKDLGLTETILKVESDSSKITYGEVFELCNKSVEQRTNLIVELRGLYPEIDYRFKTTLVEYLSSENEFVRAKRDFYRRSMEASSAATSYLEASKNYPTSLYGWDFYHAQVERSKAKFQEASLTAERTADEFLKTYQKMAADETAIAKEAHRAGIRFEPIFQKHASGNRKAAEDTKQAAQRAVTILGKKS